MSPWLSRAPRPCVWPVSITEMGLGWIFVNTRLFNYWVMSLHVQGCLKHSKKLLIRLWNPFLGQPRAAPHTGTRRACSASRGKHKHCCSRTGQGRPWEGTATATGFPGRKLVQPRGEAHCKGQLDARQLWTWALFLPGPPRREWGPASCPHSRLLQSGL